MRARRLLVLVAVVGAGAGPATSTADARDVTPAPGEMKFYDGGKRIPARELVAIGRPEDHGGETLAGCMRLSARTDFRRSATGSWAGVLQATKGTARYRMSQDRHETVLYGSLQITDQFGNRHELGVGDTYLARQGTTITWRATSPIVQTTFVTYPAADVLAPVRIYRVGDVVAQDQLESRGSAEDWGATVLAGEPNPLVRIDVEDSGVLAGIFQTSRSRVMIPVPFTIEHGTMLKNRAVVTDQLGNRYDLGPGDSYLAHDDSYVIWDQSDRFTQKTFFTGTEQP